MPMIHRPEPIDELAPVGLTELRRWYTRAQTLAQKSVELFNLVEARLGEDAVFTSFAGDTMCSSDELRNMIEAEIEERESGL